MPIVDARAISYDQMVNFATGKPIQVQSQIQMEPHDTVAIVSITDNSLPRLFQSNDRVLAVEFADIEPMDISFVPPAGTEYMTEAQAVEIVSFIENVHSRPEKTLLLVNCRHGMCRSGAVVDFTGMTCGLGYWNTRKRNPQIVPNHWVQYLLMKEHFKRRLTNG